MNPLVQVLAGIAVMGLAAVAEILSDKYDSFVLVIAPFFLFLAGLALIGHGVHQ